MNNFLGLINVEAGLEVLRNDQKMRVLIQKYDKPSFNLGHDYFQSLLKSIIYQQLSGNAAKSIYERFVTLIPKKCNLSPREVLKLDKSKMRESGLSFNKIDYIINLADYFLENNFQDKSVSIMTENQIVRELTQIKGIGQWTVDMFLIFTLNRADILPYTDLGIKKGFKKILSKKDLPSKKEMEICSKKWRPHRTIACWYLWKVADDKYVY